MHIAYIPPWIHDAMLQYQFFSEWYIYLFACFSLQVVCDGFLTKIQKAHFNPFHSSLASSDPMLTCKLLWKTVVRKSF